MSINVPLARSEGPLSGLDWESVRLTIPLDFADTLVDTVLFDSLLMARSGDNRGDIGCSLGSFDWLVLTLSSWGEGHLQHVPSGVGLLQQIRLRARL